MTLSPPGPRIRSLSPEEQKRRKVSISVPPRLGYHTGMIKILVPSLLIACALVVYFFMRNNAPSLLEAADDGNLSQVTRLLKKGYDVNERDSNGYTPLMWAVGDSNKIAVVKALLDKGADVNVRAQEGETPLIIACFNGNIEVVKLLLEKGADVNVKNKRGKTPLEQAVSYGRTQVADLLRQYATKEQQNPAEAPK